VLTINPGLFFQIPDEILNICVEIDYWDLPYTEDGETFFTQWIMDYNSDQDPTPYTTWMCRYFDPLAPNTNGIYPIFVALTRQDLYGLQMARAIRRSRRYPDFVSSNLRSNYIHLLPATRRMRHATDNRPGAETPEDVVEGMLERNEEPESSIYTQVLRELLGILPQEFVPFDAGFVSPVPAAARFGGNK